MARYARVCNSCSSLSHFHSFFHGAVAVKERCSSISSTLFRIEAEHSPLIEAERSDLRSRLDDMHTSWHCIPPTAEEKSKDVAAVHIILYYTSVDFVCRLSSVTGLLRRWICHHKGLSTRLTDTQYPGQLISLLHPLLVSQKETR